MPLLKRRTATTADDGRPWCHYCHVAVSVDAHGCCELGHRVMSPEDAAILHAGADVEARDAGAPTPAPIDRAAGDPSTDEDDDLESLIAEAAQAEGGPDTNGDGTAFEGEYQEARDAARDLADELDSLSGPPSSSDAPTESLDQPRTDAPTESLAPPRTSAPTESLSARHSSAPTEPLGSPADAAPTTRLDGGEPSNDDPGLDDLDEDECAAAHAHAGHRRGESALDGLLDFGDEQA